MTSLKNFSSPHCHVQSLDSASTPEAFAERELELGTGTLSCTDHGSMGACSEVYEIAKKKGLTPILGLEAYLRDDDCPILAANGIKKLKKNPKTGDLEEHEHGTTAHYLKYMHLTLHARNQQAYEALVKKLSDADFRAEQHGSERKPLFNWNQLEELGSHDITMTSGCLIGVVQRHLLVDRPDLAMAYYKKIRSIPRAGNFYVEIFPHECTHFWVSGVFITLEGGEKLKFWKGKKVKTSNISKEISVEALAKFLLKGADPGMLMAVKNGHTWEDREPKQILDCKVVEDFMPNECRGIFTDGDVQLGANKFVVALAERYGDKILISDDAHFARPEDKVVQDARLTSSGGSWKMHKSYHRFSSDEAFNYFKHKMGVGEAQYEAWVNNNQEWASSFKDFKFVDPKSLPTKFYPANTLAHLKVLIDKHGRMDWSNPVWASRLQSEITLLHKNGTVDLLPYFFLAEEVVDLYDNNRLLTGPGRGSAAGLLTAYLLGITHVDPIRYGLSQDRFMTVDRIQSGKLPDVDQDLPQRELLLDPKEGWLFKRFGDHQAAISTNTMLRLKSSIKDVARATHGHVPPDVEVLCKKLKMPPQGIEDYDFIFGYVGDDKKEVKGLFEESPELQAYAADRPEEWKTVVKMLGIARQKSRHACAYVICNQPVDSFIPLTSISGIRTTQYTAPSVEARGGLKMDFLGVNSLTDIGYCLQYVQERNGGLIMEAREIDGKKVLGHRIVPRAGKFYDIWDLPEDQKVFNDIATGSTETVFQLNTKSAQQWLKQFNYIKDASLSRKAIDSVEAISAFTALDRPGPLDAIVTDATGKGHNMLVEYARRARGEPAVGSIETMNKMLPETYGVMVYQEQLQAVYQRLTGCNGIEANNFRQIVAKKQMEKVNKAYLPFIDKASSQIGSDQAQKAWEQMVTFGQYGFNKSHAVCYSVIAYACAYLKHYYPLEWWCAVLRNADKKEIVENFWRYCSKFVALPDISRSGAFFEVRDDIIVAPLSFLQGVGPAAQKELAAGLPYEGIQDFCNKIEATKMSKATINEKTGKGRKGTSALNYGIVAKLIVAGVADSLFPPQTSFSDKLTTYERCTRVASKKKENSSAKQDPAHEKYTTLSALNRYQLQKEILPIHSEDLLPILFDQKFHGVKKANSDTDHVWCYEPTRESVLKELKSQGGVDLGAPIPLRGGSELKVLGEDVVIDEGDGFTAAGVGYVISERRFSYKDGEAEGLNLTFDVDGQQFSLVKWPDRETGILHAPTNLKGALVLVVMSRYRMDKPFVIDAIVVVQPPLKAAKKVVQKEQKGKEDGLEGKTVSVQSDSGAVDSGSQRLGSEDENGCRDCEEAGLQGLGLSAPSL